MGLIPLVLVLFSLFRRQKWHERAISLLGLGQVFAVALTGLLAAETARVFLFMAPLLVLSADGELAHWTARERMVVYACMLAAAGAVARNLLFVCA
jgi:hypothetical protein